MRKIVGIGMLLIVVIGCTAYTGYMLSSWNIGDDYVIQFAGGGAAGTFSELSGEIIFDEKNLETAKMNVSVKANTIDTGNKKKNKHAKGEQWLDVEKFPEITLESTTFHHLNYGYEVHAMLGMHGFYKNVSIPFEFSKTEQGGLFTGSFIVNRQDFKITGPFMSFMVDDEFEVKLKVPVN